MQDRCDLHAGSLAARELLLAILASASARVFWASACSCSSFLLWADRRLLASAITPCSPREVRIHLLWCLSRRGICCSVCCLLYSSSAVLNACRSHLKLTHTTMRPDSVAFWSACARACATFVNEYSRASACSDLLLS